MDIHEYFLEHLVRERLHDARSATARHALVLESRPPRRPLRARLGAALIALGERVAGPPVSLRPYATPGPIHR